MDEDIKRATDMHIHEAKEDVMVLNKPLHQYLDQGTHVTGPQRDESCSSNTGMVSYRTSSTSGSPGHSQSDIESNSSSTDWLSDYKRPTSYESKFHSSSVSSNYASIGEGRFNTPSERQHGMQSVPGLGHYVHLVADKLAAPKEEEEEPKNNIFLHFGLDEEDLEYLLSYPEDQITVANMPFILLQIRIQKARRATTAVQPKPESEPTCGVNPSQLGLIGSNNSNHMTLLTSNQQHPAKITASNSLPTPAMKHDFAVASARIFPHICSLCDKECTHMKDWISHKNTSLYRESCRLLQKQAACKDAKPSASAQTSQHHHKKKKRSRSRSSSFRPRRHHRPEGRKEKQSRRSQLSHSSRYTRRSPERRLLSTGRDKQRFTQKRNDKRRSSPETSDKRQSAQRRSNQRSSSREGLSPQQKKPTCDEILVEKILKTSAVQSLSKESDVKAVAKTVAHALLAELAKMKSSSSSSSSPSPPSSPETLLSPPSAEENRLCSPASSSPSSSPAKRESTTKPSLHESEKMGALTGNPLPSANSFLPATPSMGPSSSYIPSSEPQPDGDQTLILTSIPTPSQPQPKKNLCLTGNQLHAAQQMFKTANKVTRGEKALILGFMAGSRENPCPELGDIIQIKLSEHMEILPRANGTGSTTMLVDTVCKLNYSTGQLTYLKKYQPITSTSRGASLDREQQ